jgi:hypothetical protein
VKAGTTYTLERGAEVLGILTVASTGGFAVQATFDPTPAFDSYRPLFDEDAGFAHRLAADPAPDLLEQAEAVMERILALGLRLRREGEMGHRTFLLSIEGQEASFRPLTPEEEPL